MVPSLPAAVQRQRGVLRQRLAEAVEQVLHLRRAARSAARRASRCRARPGAVGSPRAALRRSAAGRARAARALARLGLARRGRLGLGRGHAGLVGPEPGVALLDLGRGGLGDVGRAGPAVEQDDPQHVADLVERVDAERLEVDVVPERLHAGEALARLVGGLVGRGRRAAARPAGRSRSSAGGRRSSGGTGAAACPAAARTRPGGAARAISCARLAQGARCPRRRPRRGPSIDPRRLARERLGARAGSAPARARRAAGCAAWGSAASAVRSSSAMRRLELGQEVGQAVPVAAQLLGARGLDAGGVRASSAQLAPRCSLTGSTAARHGVRVADEVADDLVLAAQDRERLGQLAQRRVRAADHLVQLLGAAGQAGAELVEDQPEALAVGAAHHRVDQVGRDRRGGALHRARARRRAAPRRACPGRSR